MGRRWLYSAHLRLCSRWQRRKVLTWDASVWADNMYDQVAHGIFGRRYAGHSQWSGCHALEATARLVLEGSKGQRCAAQSREMCLGLPETASQLSPRLSNLLNCCPDPKAIMSVTPQQSKLTLIWRTCGTMEDLWHARGGHFGPRSTTSARTSRTRCEVTRHTALRGHACQAGHLRTTAGANASPVLTCRKAVCSSSRKDPPVCHPIEVDHWDQARVVSLPDTEDHAGQRPRSPGAARRSILSGVLMMVSIWSRRRPIRTSQMELRRGRDKRLSRSP
jgi:hypothetical protein